MVHVCLLTMVRLNSPESTSNAYEILQSLGGHFPE